MSVADAFITAVIPLYNGACYISHALDSVLAQELPPDEIIVVDDGSTDDGPDIVRGYATKCTLTILQKPNGGQSSARNLGIRHASGALIALLDQDDVWYPHHLSKLARPFCEETAKTIGWSYSNLDEIGDDGKLRRRSILDAYAADHPKMDISNCLQQDMFVLPSASLILRSAIEDVGYFDERLSGYEDDDLFIRLFVAGYHNVYVKEALGQWRITSSSSSYSPRMAVSRMIYARKLIESFPDQPILHRYYSSKLVAPRFLQQAVTEARDSLARGDVQTAEKYRDDIDYLERTITPDPLPYPVRDHLLVTAVVLMRNGGRMIREVLHSVQQQGRRVDEIVVVDDGSTDDGSRIVQEMATDRRIRLIRKPRGTRAAARNEGVRMAHGDVVAFLDQDDRWHFDHVEVLLNPFRERRPIALGWTCADIAEVDVEGRMVMQHRPIAAEVPQPKRSLTDCLGHDMLVVPSAAMVSRKAYQAVGGCDARLDACEDDDLFLRLFQAGYGNIHIGHPITSCRRERSLSVSQARVVSSQKLFVDKLLEQFVPESAADELKLRPLIVERFLKYFTQATRSALHLGDAETADLACRYISDLRQNTALNATGGVNLRDQVVSAVVPLRNGAASTVKVLCSALRQSRPVDEVIVVNYGPADGCLEAIGQMPCDPRIRVINHPCTTRGAARNIGVEHARGEVIAFLDVDCVWYDHHIQTLLEPFCVSRRRKLGWAYATADEVGRDGSMLVPNYLGGLPGNHPKTSLIDCLSADINVLPSAALVSRQAYLAVGGCDERLATLEDDDLFVRLFQAGYDNAYIHEPLSAWCQQSSLCCEAAEIAASRRLYLHRLLEQFPDEPHHGRYFARDLIAPRFFRAMLTDARKAILSGNLVEQREAVANLGFVTRRLAWRKRVPLQTLLLPLLNIRPIARLIMQSRIAAFRLYRMFVRA